MKDYEFNNHSKYRRRRQFYPKFHKYLTNISLIILQVYFNLSYNEVVIPSAKIVA